MLPDGLGQVGAVCSLGLLAFQVFSPSLPQKEVSLFSLAPLALTTHSPYEDCIDEPQGFRATRELHLPVSGALPCLTFFTD
jgi:hypothetical protein